jgi:phosphopantothenoylcysteine decarboxylase/phosphopantothenate--cysteine ligase
MSKLVDKRLDLIVLNDVAQPAIGMNSEDNEVTVFDAGGVVTHISRRAKAAVATALVDVVVARLAPGQR